jgi:hypothetical protein
MITKNLTDMSVEELEKHTEKVIELLVIKRARQKLNSGEKLIPATEVFKRLEKC